MAAEDPGIKLVLEELRDLRVEMLLTSDLSAPVLTRHLSAQGNERASAARERAARRRADEERRRTDEEHWRADEEWRQEWREERTRSDERFGQLMSEMKFEFREFREESARREAAIQKTFTDAFKQVHTVGLAIVKTLNRHTQILERIDRKLGAPGNGRRGRNDGRGG